MYQGITLAQRRRVSNQRKFLQHLATTGDIFASTKLAGVSRSAVYYWINNDSGFKKKLIDAAEESDAARELDALTKAKIQTNPMNVTIKTRLSLQRQFLHHLRNTGSVEESAKLVHRTPSTCIYRWTRVKWFKLELAEVLAARKADNLDPPSEPTPAPLPLRPFNPTVGAEEVKGLPAPAPASSPAFDLGKVGYAILEHFAELALKHNDASAAKVVLDYGLARHAYHEHNRLP